MPFTGEVRATLYAQMVWMGSWGTTSAIEHVRADWRESVLSLHMQKSCFEYIIYHLIIY